VAEESPEVQGGAVDLRFLSELYGVLVGRYSVAVRLRVAMKRAASECSDNDVFFDDGDMLKDGSVSHLLYSVQYFACSSRFSSRSCNVS